MKVLNWDFIKKCLASRREHKRLTDLGYRRYETDWEILRGSRYMDVIIDAKISVCGKYIYVKLGKIPEELR